jgi:ribosomal protein L13E
LSSDSKKSKKKSVKQKSEGAVKGVEKEAKKVEKEVERGAEKVEKAIKQEVKKAKEPKPRPSFARPSGKVPEAMVMSRHGTGMVTRHGRGFSVAELSGAGIPPRTAARWGAMIDPRRRSTLEENVTALKAWGSHVGTGGTLKKEAKEVEEKVEEVAREIRVDAEVAEEEAAKAEHAVKKEVKEAEREVKKAGKAVKKKVERKPRPKKKGGS